MNIMNNRILIKAKNYLLCLLPLMIALIVHAVVINIGTPLINATGMKTISTDTKREILLIVSAAFCILIFSLWYRRISKDQDKSARTTLLNIKLLPLLLLLGISLQLCLTMALVSLSGNSPSSGTKIQFSVVTLIFEGLFAPFSDELIFRGVMLKTCRKHMPLFIANVLQAIAFGFYHGNLIQGIYAFALGLLLGYITIWFHSIWFPIFLHMVINVTPNLLILIPANPASYAFIIIIISVTVAIVAFLLIKQQRLPFNKPQDDSMKETKV